MLWPLSMGERLGVRETFLDLLFEPTSWPGRTGALPRADLIPTLLEGGYPEIVTEGLAGRHRRNWFEAYVHDVVSREALLPIVEVRLETKLRRLLRLLAARTGQEPVGSGIAGDAEVGRDTASNYVTLLEALHLVAVLPARSTNITTRAKRRPRVLVVDTGLPLTFAGSASRRSLRRRTVPRRARCSRPSSSLRFSSRRPGASEVWTCPTSATARVPRWT